MSTFQLKINVDLLRLFYFAVPSAYNAEFERFNELCDDSYYTLLHEITCGDYLQYVYDDKKLRYFHTTFLYISNIQ